MISFIHKATMAAAILAAFNLQAQKETNNWLFGQYGGLEFNSTPPAPIVGGQIDEWEGCTSISDANGNLLFYTDGMWVWNKGHAMMPNGTGLLGSQSPAQGMVVIKRPGSATLYDIFTVEGNFGSNGLTYSTVDMSLAGGNGSVTVKNQPVYSSFCTEYIAAVNHCNGSDVWVMIHQAGSAVFRAYLVTSAGVSNTAVTSTVGSVHTGSIGPGCMKFSSNGRKLAIALCQNVPNVNHVEVYDFDNATGTLSNAVVLSTKHPVIYGLEISPDGTKVYAAQGHPQMPQINRVMQWDLCAGSPTAMAASEFTVATPPRCPASLQQASNGKIYVAQMPLGDTVTVISVINNPNLPGAACGYSEAAQPIGGGCRAGLPGFNSSFFMPPQPSYTVPLFTHTVSGCNQAAFAASALSANCTATAPLYTGVNWIFDDPASGPLNVSSALTPTHAFSSGGTFNVKLIYLNNCRNDTVTMPVVVSAAPTIAVTGNTNVCIGTKVTLTATGAPSFTWNNGSSASATFSVIASASAVYTVAGSSGTCAVTRTVAVTVNECLGFEEGGFGGVRVYPNPAGSELFIETDRPLRAIIRDLNGRVLKEASLPDGKNKMPADDLAEGMYLLEVSTGETRTVKIIVKQRF